MTPGEIVFGEGPVPILEGRPVTVLHVESRSTIDELERLLAVALR